MAVRDKDKGWIRLVQTAQSAGSVVRVGIQGDKATTEHGDDEENGGLTNVELGTIHEYGAPLAGIDERSFIRATLDEKSSAYVKFVRFLSQGVIDGVRTREQALGLLGERVRADIAQRINDGRIEPDITDATKERKGSSKPLIDTGQLKNSITYVVGSKR